MAPAIRELLDTLEPGEVGGPVETATGFHLVERLDYAPASLPALADCRARIVGYLAREQRSRALSAWVDALQKEAVIEHLAD